MKQSVNIPPKWFRMFDHFLFHKPFCSLDSMQQKETKCCLACSRDKILLSLNKLIFQLFMLHSTRFTIAMINHDLGCPTCSTNLKQGRLWRSPWHFGHEPVFHGIVIPSSSSLYSWNQGSVVTWYIGNWELGSRYIGNWKIQDLFNSNKSNRLRSRLYQLGIMVIDRWFQSSSY